MRHFPARQDANYASAREQNDHQQQRAQKNLPVIADAAQKMLQQNIEASAGDGFHADSAPTQT